MTMLCRVHNSAFSVDWICIHSERFHDDQVTSYDLVGEGFELP